MGIVCPSLTESFARSCSSGDVSGHAFDALENATEVCSIGEQFNWHQFCFNPPHHHAVRPDLTSLWYFWVFGSKYKYNKKCLIPLQRCLSLFSGAPCQNLILCSTKPLYNGKYIAIQLARFTAEPRNLQSATAEPRNLHLLLCIQSASRNEKRLSSCW